ncbi:AfsR/SARP family transcriptional regulator [Kitasatospora viridis]|uniref:Transcriptional regulator n=1 Tax=Kitasatospora viridis TaxID=281105 RepID=A0A561SE35_9ACTN|nr:BTAD domain-containing putative transcriptional regulator [Kitasatospora viridis]TWF73124.1 transcriptional regulator [Kitasatospora viridis]
MRFQVLGPLVIQPGDGGGELRANRAQDRAVLAVLLAEAGRPVPTDRIIEGVWGEEPDDAPDRAKALPGNVYRLRKLLEPLGPDILRRVAQGYQLDIDPAAVDRTAFLAALERAATARRNHQPERARAELAEALALWTGPALENVPGPYAEHERRVLAGRRDQARLARLELDLELGRDAAELLPELADLVREQPGRQHPAALLALARHRLDPTAPAPADRLPWTDRTPLRPVLRPFQLPADLADFTGRPDELAAVVETLRSPRPDAAPTVVLTGPAGVGKTALATHAAHRLRPDYPDGQLHVDLQGDGDGPVDPADALAGALRALGVECAAVPDGLADRRALFRRLLAGRRVLVLVDGAADAGQARPLLPGVPGCAALVTAVGDRCLARLDASLALRLAPLSEAESAALIERVLGPGRAAEEPAAVSALTSHCGHLPRRLRAAADRLLRRPGWRIAALVAGTDG